MRRFSSLHSNKKNVLHNKKNANWKEWFFLSLVSLQSYSLQVIFVYLSTPMVDDKVQRIEIHLHLFAFFSHLTYQQGNPRRTNELQSSEFAQQWILDQDQRKWNEMWNSEKRSKTFAVLLLLHLLQILLHFYNWEKRIKCERTANEKKCILDVGDAKKCDVCLGKGF